MYDLTEQAVRIGNRYVDFVGWYLISPVGTISGFVSTNNAANGVFFINTQSLANTKWANYGQYNITARLWAWDEFSDVASP